MYLCGLVEFYPSQLSVLLLISKHLHLLLRIKSPLVVVHLILNVLYLPQVRVSLSGVVAPLIFDGFDELLLFFVSRRFGGFLSVQE